MSPRPLTGGRWIRRLLGVVLLTLVAGWTTLHSPTIFFDNHILLGASLGVFALLQYGWLGLPVGLVAALATTALWGHPWGALVLVLQLVWQQLFLIRFNGGPAQLGNGRIVLATIVFWLLVGLPLRTLLYVTLLQADLPSVMALNVKEAVVGVVNAGLGLLLYLALQGLQLRRHGGDLSLRGLTFATLLLLISLPGVLIITVMGQQITSQSLAQFRLGLAQQAESITLLLPPGGASLAGEVALRQRMADVAFEAVAADGGSLSSDPALFARLQRDYRPDRRGLQGGEEFTLLVRREPQPGLQSLLQGYWRYDLALPPSTTPDWRRITVVQPARQQLEHLLAMMRPSLQILGLLLIAAALVSEALTTLLASQFNRIVASLDPASAPGDAATRQLGMPELQPTQLSELNRIVRRINHQGHIVNQLSAELRQSHERLRQSEQRHRLLADNALDVITISDPNGRPTYISPSIEQVRGWTVVEAMALPMEQQLTAAGYAYVTDALRQTKQALSQGLPLPSFRVELQQSHRNGSWIWTDVTSSCIVDEAGHYIGTLLVYRDISERKRLEDELLARASLDELTGLLSRRALLEQLEALLSHHDRRRDDEGLALLFCDLDQFKEINDSLGHGMGDTVLRTVAERISGCLRADDLVGRTGGDEIVVGLRSIPDLDTAMVIAEAIRRAIAQPITTAEQRIGITASIGVTLARAGEGVDELIARADLAMYRAKAAGRDRVIRIA